MIKLLLVNKNRLFNEAIATLLSTEPDMKVVGTIEKGPDIMKAIEEKEPDIVLLDAHMPNVDSIKMTIHMKDNYPHIKVILLTSFRRKKLVVSGIMAGADGFLFNSIDTENFLQSIRNAYNNQMTISGEAARILADEVIRLKYDRHSIVKRQLEKRNIHFSDREVEVALLMSEKMTNKNIAKKLFLSEGTIKNYVSEIYSKLNIRTRKEIIAYIRSLYSA